MGFKVVPEANAVPVEMQDGIVKYMVGDKPYVFEVEGFKNHSFKLQCNQYSGPGVILYAINPYEIFILRDNGTGTIMFSESKVIISNFLYDYDLPESELVGSGGSVYQVNNERMTPVPIVLYRVGNGYLMSCDSVPFSATFVAVDETQYCYDTERKLAMMCPLLWLKNGSIIAINDKFVQLYTMHAKANVSEGFICLS